MTNFSSECNAGIDVIGRSCRLPGAKNITEFWQLLINGRCSVTEVGPERFSMFRYKNPRRQERGKSYTFAAGVLDDIWGFDPAVFAISPREAAQMDPQQRLLLMLVWEALEDAGLPPSSVAGRNVGVFVGNSGVDHNNRFLFDPAGSDSYMMTGNTGALISNRISYIFDLHGPSMTVDTACSSSLVALDEAVNALRSGRIDMAIVAGVNLLLSPFPFVGFSAASMLSPEGLCRPFDKEAYGYVRAEGGVVLLLVREDDNAFAVRRRHARIIETGVNSDGRTVGVALPSAEYQAELLKAVYGRAGVDTENLAFVEAHGTGTRVGDPAEAMALGSVLGKPRRKPLPIGSVKSNVGHLEPASGIVGLLKAMLALEHNLLPASLHFTTPNPDIPFSDLNIEVAGESRVLPQGEAPRFAGVSNFGFGGTNVHVILTDPPRQHRKLNGVHAVPRNKMLLLSAHCRGALKDLARQYTECLEHCDTKTSDLSNAAIYQRERMAERIVAFGGDAEAVATGLRTWSDGETAANVFAGKATGATLKTVLVYSGNGSQWAGMGRDAFRRNERFAWRFRQTDALFSAISDWSLEEMLFADDLREQLASTTIAQPLLFALQVALTAELRDMGLLISGVLGHSVGEVAAAWASGALSLEQAVQVIYVRSLHQEGIRGKGLMVAVRMPEAEMRDALAKGDLPGLEISANNSPYSVTISGPREAIERFVQHAKRQNWTHKLLDIEYPFHNSIIDPFGPALIEALDHIEPSQTQLPYYSTVTGKQLSGEQLDARYWWENVRQPVRFADAVRAADADGCRLFLEIGPKPILRGYLSETTGELKASYTVIHSFDQNGGGETDPVTQVFARAIASGADFDPTPMFGRDLNASTPLPSYPWQYKSYKIAPSPEALEALVLAIPPHALLGQQIRQDEFVWNAHLDTQLYPFLRDHKVDGKVILPGAAFVEIALAAAQQWLAGKLVELRDMDIMQHLMLSDDFSVDVRTRLNPETGTVEIASRKRLSDDGWQTHARCRVAVIPGGAIPRKAAPELRAADDPEAVRKLYALSQQFGLDFGPNFQRMIRCEEPAPNVVEVVLNERSMALDPQGDDIAAYMLHPLDLDACFHGLNVVYDKIDLSEDKLAFIPVRFGTLRIYAPHRAVRTARITLHRLNSRGGQADFDLFDADGQLVATLEDARFRAAALVARHTLSRTSYSVTHQIVPLPAEATATAAPPLERALEAVRTLTTSGEGALADQRLLLEAAARRVAYDILVSLTDDHGVIDLGALPAMAGNESGPDDGAERQRAAWQVAMTSALLAITEQSGMAELEDPKWRLSHICQLPPVAYLTQTLLTENPRWLAECVLLNRAAALLPAILNGERPLETEEQQGTSFYSTPMLEQLESSSPTGAIHIEAVASMVEALLAEWPVGKPLRILELGAGSGALTKRILPMVERKHGHLRAVDTNKTNVHRLEMLFTESACFDACVADDEALVLANGTFDLLVSANGLHRMANGHDLLANAARTVAMGGLAIVSTTAPDTFHDVTFGPMPGWFSWSADPQFPRSPLRTGEEWLQVFRASGFDNAQALPCPGKLDNACIVLATRTHGAPDSLMHNGAKGSARDESAAETSRNVVILATDMEAEARFARRLTHGLAAHGFASNTIAILSPGSLGELAEYIGGRLEDVDLVHLDGAFDEAADSPQQAVRARIEALTNLLQKLDIPQGRLWIVAPGGARAAVGAGTPSPAQSGIWAFGRTVLNEYSAYDVRLVDFASDLDHIACATRLAALLAQPGAESELVLTREAAAALRITRGLANTASERASAESAQAIVLTHPVGGALDRMHWVAAKRVAPKTDQIEIEIAATGLNFRDVMWAQGLLPEEALEDGFAGPTLGFECSGRVVGIGEKVTGLKLGDPVMAFAPQCFASHVTVSQSAVAKLPKNVSLQAAATIPVAYLTAYYALHHLAHLQPNEWVLIHGAAGGVGLAALQIAKWAKAKVIATAGSEEKRQFLKTLGADHILNTRSLDFFDEVAAITDDDTGRGVDVVLNSLAAEAMERSIELLRPFGRFLELGKRDFYANSKIGLRPFRRNLSYFGIDADQLLNHRPKLTKRLFAELADLFANGRLTPLPYRLFEAPEIFESFRLMQQSGHIGKIVVKAPCAGQGIKRRTSEKFEANGHGTHIIVGGLGGFGLEAASWLADHGARSIVLTGRSGTLTDEARETLTALQRSGVAVEVARCDVIDGDALNALLTRLRRERPIKGIMHVAMVLEDALIQNLTPEQIGKVLKPKVEGVENIERQTRDDALDFFVMFSSAAAMFGNPGQANYVAANAYLEGVARRRRLEGLPALAVGWGAITDAGVLTRNQTAADSLARHTGGIEFKARQALNLLGQILASDRGEPEQAVVALAAMNWGFAKDTLPIMRTPAFRNLAKEAASGVNRNADQIDLEKLIAGLGEQQAIEKISHLLAEEVSGIFRMPAEDINLKRPLVEIGMDSLMGMELRAAAQRNLGIDIPIVSIADGTTINDIAVKVLTRVRGGDGRVPGADYASNGVNLIQQHSQYDVDTDTINSFAHTPQASGDAFIGHAQT